MGLFNFYRACEKIDRLSLVSHILKYSCAKTIAIRKKINMSKVFKKYTGALKIKQIIKTSKGKMFHKEIKFLDLSMLRQRLKEKQQRTPQ